MIPVGNGRFFRHFIRNKRTSTDYEDTKVSENLKIFKIYLSRVFFNKTDRKS